jgi:hypothetical protein
MRNDHLRRVLESGLGRPISYYDLLEMDSVQLFTLC